MNCLKKVNYKIKIQAIKIKIKAELNEELLKKIQVESIDQLKEIFHDQLINKQKTKNYLKNMNK